MNATPSSQTLPKPFFQRHAITIKLLGVLFLVLILLIPLGMIGSILQERRSRCNEAVSGITSTWGSDQTISGPVLVVPYQYRYKTWKERTVDGKIEKVEVEETAVANAYFLPDDLTIDGSVTPKILHRGIYDAVVYSSSLEISGRFPEVDYAELGVPEEDFLWEKASVTLAVSECPIFAIVARTWIFGWSWTSKEAGVSISRPSDAKTG
jgi:inner membrane protein